MRKTPKKLPVETPAQKKESKMEIKNIKTINEIGLKLEANMNYTYTDKCNFENLCGKNLPVAKNREEGLKTWPWAEEKRITHREKYLLDDGTLIVAEGFLWRARGKQKFSCFAYHEKNNIAELRLCQKNIMKKAETEIAWIEKAISAHG